MEKWRFLCRYCLDIEDSNLSCWIQERKVTEFGEKAWLKFFHDDFSCVLTWNPPIQAPLKGIDSISENNHCFLVYCRMGTCRGSDLENDWRTVVFFPKNVAKCSLPVDIQATIKCIMRSQNLHASRLDSAGEPSELFLIGSGDIFRQKRRSIYRVVMSSYKQYAALQARNKRPTTNMHCI